MVFWIQRLSLLSANFRCWRLEMVSWFGTMFSHILRKCIATELYFINPTELPVPQLRQSGSNTISLIGLKVDVFHLISQFDRFEYWLNESNSVFFALMWMNFTKSVLQWETAYGKDGASSCNKMETEMNAFGGSKDELFSSLVERECGREQTIF